MAGNFELEVAIKAKDDASAVVQNLGKNVKAMSAGFVAVGGAITGAMAFAVKSAAGAEVEMAKFNTILKNTGDVSDKTRDALLSAANAAVKKGFDDEAAAVSLATLYQRTGDVNEAMKLNALAMDLSRTKGIDLEAATTAINQTLSGGGKILKQYGIEINDTTTPLEALGLLQAKVGGQADAFTKTLEGQSESLKQQFGNLIEMVGGVLIPILIKAFEKIQPVIDRIVAWTEANPVLTEKIVLVTAAVGAILLVLGTLGLVLPPIIASVSAFGAVLAFLAANPIVLIIAALVALGVMIYKVASNWDESKKSILEITGVLRDGLAAIWHAIGDTVMRVWDGITAKITAAFDFIMEKVNAAKRAWDSMASAMSSPIQTFKSDVKAIGQSISGKRADGGPVSAGGSYIVGERGPEIFTPSSSGHITANGAGGITVNINGGTYLSERVALEIGDMIVRRLQMVTRFDA